MKVWLVWEHLDWGGGSELLKIFTDTESAAAFKSSLPAINPESGCYAIEERFIEIPVRGEHG